jgi:formylmethanofuran dehydrogenase subunit B
MPLVYGLSNVTCECSEAVSLAEKGAVIDSHTSP